MAGENKTNISKNLLYRLSDIISVIMKIRRVVTDHNEKGQSVVKWDSEIEGVSKRPGSARYSLKIEK